MKSDDINDLVDDLPIGSRPHMYAVAVAYIVNKELCADSVWTQASSKFEAIGLAYEYIREKEPDASEIKITAGEIPAFAMQDTLNTEDPYLVDEGPDT